jgi:ketosteroid isomerase-like protein
MSDDTSLRATSDRFYAAVQAVLRGDAAPMLALWSRDDEASYCDTRGEIVLGWPTLEAYWRTAAAANAADATLSATGLIQRAVVTGDLAYVVAVEEVHQAGATSVMQARATNVYRREAAAGWRLLHRHADAAPRISEPERA